MNARAARWSLALALVLSSPRATAASVVETPPERARTEAVAEALARQILQALEGAPSGGALVVRVGSELPERAPDPHGLVHALVQPSALALDESRRWTPVHVGAFEGEGDEAARRAARLGYDVLVDVDIRTVGNFLRAEGAVWTTDPPARRGPLEVVSRLDVDLRRYLGRQPRVRAETLVARSLELPSRGYLAMIVHDLDGDRRSELLLLARDHVSILRLGGAPETLLELARLGLPADVPRASSPPRRALATGVRRERAVVLRSSALAAPIRVTLDEQAPSVARTEGPCPDDAFPIDVGCARLAPGHDFFEPTIAAVAEAPPREAAAHWYAYAATRLRTPDARVVAYEALVTPAGRLALRIDGRAVGATYYGTALAMADLDDDGAAELLTSSPAPAGEGDHLSILRALPRGALHRVWRSEPLEGAVWIAASGDLDGDGRAALLAIEERAEGPARLWVVR